MFDRSLRERGEESPDGVTNAEEGGEGVLSGSSTFAGT